MMKTRSLLKYCTVNKYKPQIKQFEERTLQTTNVSLALEELLRATPSIDDSRNTWKKYEQNTRKTLITLQRGTQGRARAKWKQQMKLARGRREEQRKHTQKN